MKYTCFPLCQTYKPTDASNLFPKGQSVAKPRTPLPNILVANMNLTKKESDSNMQRLSEIFHELRYRHIIQSIEYCSYILTA